MKQIKGPNWSFFMQHNAQHETTLKYVTCYVLYVSYRILATRYKILYTEIMSSNFFSDWIQVFRWWYTDFPKELSKQQKLAFLAVVNFFSFEILLKTLFQPWKKDTQSYDRKTLQERIEILGLNFISRFFGFLVRLFAILGGLIILFLLIIFFILLWFAWVVAPSVAIILFVVAIKEFNGGAE